MMHALPCRLCAGAPSAPCSPPDDQTSGPLMRPCSTCAGAGPMCTRARTSDWIASVFTSSIALKTHHVFPLMCSGLQPRLDNAGGCYQSQGHAPLGRGLNHPELPVCDHGAPGVSLAEEVGLGFRVSDKVSEKDNVWKLFRLSQRRWPHAMDIEYRSLIENVFSTCLTRASFSLSQPAPLYRSRNRGE